MHSYRSIAPLLLTAFALTSALGCELIAAVDHSLLDQMTATATGTGGAGGTNAGGGGNGGLGGEGGSGGEAGSTSSQGGGGAGGGEPCTTADECPGQDTDCSVRTCIGQQCGVDLTAAGTPLQTQTAGNCEQEECDGNGGVTSSVDNDDLPDDADPCTDDVCTAGSPSNPPSSQGTMCGVDLICDGLGNCVGCVDPTECPGQDDECQTRTCIGGMCDFDFTLAGTPLAMQDAGDCQEQQCDGSGNAVGADDDDDLPVDGNQCTDDVCAAGTPSNPDLAPGEMCNEAGGTVCDGNGACVQCVNASTCPVAPNECQVATCTAGMCGFSNLPDGTVTTQQTIGDCLQSECDGDGNIVDVTADADLPDDSNPCTDDICTAGVPSNPDVGAGTNCGVDQVCDGMGNCIGCIDAMTCPGQDDDCKTRTCTASMCGFDFEPLGTATTQQTAGDCQEEQCDGNGTAQSVADNADVPADDGNDCTLDVCTNGVPGHPNTLPGTTCDDNGGSVCDGDGACVECVSAATCPASPNECQVATCVANTCGFGNAAGGTPTSQQTAGDCQRNQCDGNGNIESVADNTDAPPDEGNQCTADVCVAGAPQHPNLPMNTMCTQSGGSVCDGNGACVECLSPANCPATANECQTATCVANTCGVSNVTAGTPTAQQTAGDCQQSQCDGNGNIASIADNADVPGDDGNQCTGEVCVAGAPQHPDLPMDTMCTQNGGSVCDGNGVCVECNAAAQCSGSDTECRTRTCDANTCGVLNTAVGTLTSVQIANDCQQNQCDGNGNIESVADNADVPVDDGMQCTGEVCVAGVPQHPSLPMDTMCTQNGGSVCDGNGVCVECTAPTQCSGSDTECQVRTCVANACGVLNTAVGTPTSDQTPNDCQQNECDGVGGIVSDQDNTDLPADDGNECTDQVCLNGVPMVPFSPVGAPCTQNGGTGCDGAGMCVPAPMVADTSPSDGGAAVASASIAVTFTTAMAPATLTGQTTAGACSGSVQVSIDDFASCVAFSSALATMSVGDTVATFTAAPGLLVNRAYKMRVTTAAASAVGLTLASQYTQVTGFTTTSPNLCEGSLVISQVYGGGGNAGAAFTHDFIELHNRGATAVSLAGMSLQYTSGAGTVWNNPIVLSGAIAPGGYYLVQLSSGGAVGAPLPAPDLSVTLPLISATVGKVALINSPTQIPAGICPPPALTIDMVGYGAAANCSEGGAPAPAPANPTAVVRLQAGCADVNRNASDFEVLAPTPRNTASAPSACVCMVQNESNVGLEADYCTTQFPLSLNVQTGMATPLVYGQIFEAGVTEAAGANPSVRAQLGYGPATANPEYEASWQWTNATFNVQAGDNDEYQASFTAPAVGSYSYTYRISLNQGVSWTYCDQNAGDFGAGSNAGLTFELGDVPVLTVTP